MGKRIVVLASGSGSNLQALLDHESNAKHVVAVLSDRSHAGALHRAAGAGLPAQAVPFGDHPGRAEWASELAARVATYAPDLLVLAGFMRILPAAFVERWPTMNVHPSLLPAFPGGRAVESALAWGVKLTGATVHFVDEHVDHGPIVAQEAVPVHEDDDEASLHARIQAVEHRLLPEAADLFCRGRLAVEGRHVRILP